MWRLLMTSLKGRIHRPIIMVTKYLIVAFHLEKNFKFLHNNVVILHFPISVKFCKNYLPPKNAKNRGK